jgi:hypothetical protein
VNEKVGVNTKTRDAKKESFISKKQSSDFSKTGHIPFDQTLFLQRNLGNEALQRMIESGAAQAKLKIGQFEPEIKEDKKDNFIPQFKSQTNQSPAVIRGIASRIQSLKGGGHPLPQSIRSFYESRFGRDFSNVRVHTDNKAAETAKSIDAKAFTIGKYMVFGTGQYSPGTSSGKRLLAHELTHVVQQKKNTISREPAGKPPPTTSPKETSKIGCSVFIYDTGDIKLTPIWKETAQLYARNTQGIAVQSGANSAETIKKVIRGYNEANKTGKYDCIKAIEFFGHGSPGSALSGKFSAKDFATKEILRTVRKGGREVTERSHVLKNADLQTQFTKLKGLLCSQNYFHFRTCETFKGQKGEEYAKKVSSFFKTHAVGHTKVIDTYLPGRTVFDPSERKVAKVPVSLIPAKKGVSKLPIRYLSIKVDISKMKLPYNIQKIRPILFINALILPSKDPNLYQLRLSFAKPEHFYLSEVFKKIISIISGGTGSPTGKKAITKGRDVVVPIDRTIIERFRKGDVLKFPLNIKGKGTAYIQLTAKAGTPSALRKRGGIETGVDVGATWSSRGGAFVLRPYVQYPFYNWRDLIKLSGEAAIIGGTGTIMGEGRFNVSAHLLKKAYLSLSLIGGGGQYQSKRSYLVGGGLGLGYRHKKFGAGLSADIVKTVDPGPTVNLWFRAKWIFD